MAQYILASDIFFQGAILKTGKVIDSGAYDIPLLQAAGAALVSLPNPAYAAQAALIRQRQAAGTQTSDVLAFPSDETKYPGIVWQGGGTSAPGIVTTWAEVQAFIESIPGSITVYLDPSQGTCVVPADVSFDCKGRVKFAPISFNIQGNGAVFFEDGAELLNVSSFLAVRAVGVPTIRSFLRSTIPGHVLTFREGGGVTFDVGAATKPAIQVDADFSQVALFEGAGLDNSNAPTQPIIGLNASLTFHIFAYANLIGSGPLPDTIYTGGNGGMTFLVFQDPSNPSGFVPQPGLLATPTVQKYFVASQMTASSGDTASRPTFGNTTGQMYFDTDLGTPIWWDGAQWVDATGAPA
jgi:hypothetical protein